MYMLHSAITESRTSPECLINRAKDGKGLLFLYKQGRSLKSWLQRSDGD